MNGFESAPKELAVEIVDREGISLVDSPTCGSEIEDWYAISVIDGDVRYDRVRILPGYRIEASLE